jgi:hypothetical protein
MKVVVREEQEIQVLMGAQCRGPGVVAGGKAVVLPDEHLAPRPFPEDFRLGRIASVVHDHEPIRKPDPGNLFPDEPLRTVVLTIVDDDDT